MTVNIAKLVTISAYVVLPLRVGEVNLPIEAAILADGCESA